MKASPFSTLIRTVCVLIAAGGYAGAHTIEYGFAPSGTSGVTIWFGSYHAFSEANSDGQPNEGFLQIQGINGNPFPLTAIDFDTAISAASNAPPALGYVSGYHSSTSLPTTLWQGVTFSAAIAGDYSFFFNQGASTTGVPAVSAVFSAWDNDITQGEFTLTSAVITPPPPTNNVPDSGSSLALLGLSCSGLAFLAKKKRALP